MKGRHLSSPTPGCYLPALRVFYRAHKHTPVHCQNSPYLLCISSAVDSWGSSEKWLLQRAGWPLGWLRGSPKKAKSSRWRARQRWDGGLPSLHTPAAQPHGWKGLWASRTPSLLELSGILCKPLSRVKGNYCVKLKQFRWGLCGYSELLWLCFWVLSKTAQIGKLLVYL